MDGIKILAVGASALFILIGTSLTWAGNAHLLKETKQHKSSDYKAQENWYILTTWIYVAFVGLKITVFKNKPAIREVLGFAVLVMFGVYWAGVPRSPSSQGFDAATGYAYKNAIKQLKDVKKMKKAYQELYGGLIMTMIGLVIGAVVTVMKETKAAFQLMSMKGISAVAAIGLCFVGSVIMFSLKQGSGIQFGVVGMYLVFLVISQMLFNNFTVVRYNLIISLYVAIFGLSSTTFFADQSENVDSARAGGLFIWFGAMASVFNCFLLMNDEPQEDASEGSYEAFAGHDEA